MALDFPSAPDVDDQHVVGGVTWVWNGTVWNAVSVVGATGPTGATGPVAPPVINEYTASQIALIDDENATVEMNVGSANDYEIPPNTDVAFPVRTVINVVQTGAGQTTIVAGAGVTLLSKDGNLNIAARYGAVTLYKRATNTWVVIGDLAA